MIGLVSLFRFALWWNKWDSSSLHTKAQDEPLVGALGAVLIFVGLLTVAKIRPWRWLPELSGTLLIAFGGFLIVLALVAVFSSRLDIDLY